MFFFQKIEYAYDTFRILNLIQPDRLGKNVRKFQGGGSFLTHTVYTEDRPTTDLSFGKIQITISPERIIQFTPCLVLWWGFRGW